MAKMEEELARKWREASAVRWMFMPELLRRPAMLPEWFRRFEEEVDWMAAAEYDTGVPWPLLLLVCYKYTGEELKKSFAGKTKSEVDVHAMFETSKDEDLLHQQYWKSMETQGYCLKEYIRKLILIMNVNINGTI
nr:hypothetical protein Iba_chr01aCG3160 [Ipomoea batatas]